MKYSIDYMVFMLREAVGMFERDDRCSEVGRDEWVWLQKARDILHEGTGPISIQSGPQGFCNEIASGVEPMDCVLGTDLGKILVCKGPNADASWAWESVPTPVKRGPPVPVFVDFPVSDWPILSQSSAGAVVGGGSAQSQNAQSQNAQAQNAQAQGGQSAQAGQPVNVSTTSAATLATPFTVTIVNLNSPAKDITHIPVKERESIDDIIFGPVT